MRLIARLLVYSRLQHAGIVTEMFGCTMDISGIQF
jgi:hypothetical protein